MLEVKTTGVRGVIKGEGVPEAGMDRGTHGMRMMEPEEWTDERRRMEVEGGEGVGRGDL